jgi:hypothetical protein
MSCPTYDQIIAEVRRGVQVSHTCWVAEVKRAYGLTRGPAPNRGRGNGAPPCPPAVFTVIEIILREHGSIR